MSGSSGSLKGTGETLRLARPARLYNPAVRRPRNTTLGWFAGGLVGGIGLCLLAAGATGAFLALVVAMLILVRRLRTRSTGGLAALFGLLAAANICVISLWISPPCDLSDPTTTTIERDAEGALRLVCEPRQGMGLFALLVLAGTLAIGGLLMLRERELRRRAPGEPKPPRGAVEIAAVGCAAVALAASGVAAVAVLSQNGWKPSALVRMAERDPIARYALEKDPSFALFSPEAHYDGVYFYAIASDPLAIGTPHRLIDLGAHRYTHPLYGWLGWLASFGQSRFVPHALLGINLVAMAVAGAAGSFLAARLGITPWAGLGAALNPGLIASVSFDTAEPLGAALLTLALLAWLARRRGWAALGFLFVCMTRQPFSVIPIAIAVWEIATGIKTVPRRDLVKRVALLAIGPVSMALWQVFLYFRFDELPFATGDVVLKFPFEGWVDALRLAAFHGGADLAQVGLSSLPLLIVALTLALLATYRALWSPTLLGSIFLGLMLIYFSFEELAVFFPKELLRFSAIPWLLIPFLFLQQPRRTDAYA